MGSFTQQFTLRATMFFLLHSVKKCSTPLCKPSPVVSTIVCFSGPGFGSCFDLLLSLFNA